LWVPVTWCLWWSPARSSPPPSVPTALSGPGVTIPTASWVTAPPSPAPSPPRSRSSPPPPRPTAPWRPEKSNT